MEMKEYLNAIQLTLKHKSKPNTSTTSANNNTSTSTSTSASASATTIDIGLVKVQLGWLCSNIQSYYTILHALLCIDYTKLHSALHVISVNWLHSDDELYRHGDSDTESTTTAAGATGGGIPTSVMIEIGRYKHIGRHRAAIVAGLVVVEEELIVLFTKLMKMQVCVYVYIYM